MAVNTPGFSNFTVNDSGGSCETSFPSLMASGAMDCSLGTAACITVTVTGGVAPYDWSTNLGVISGSGSSITLCPEANPGSGVGGNAFGKCAMYCCVFVSCSCSYFGCNDQINAGCSGTGCATICSATGRNCTCSSCSGCSPLDCCLGGQPGCMSVNSCNHGGCCGTTNNPGNGCACLAASGAQADLRTGTMISAGCNPCSISMAGGNVTVTVTDALGSSAFVVIDVTDPDGKPI
jgi:hypothetical protein